MLYLSFRITLMFTSAMGILVMVAKENYDYLFFPIVMLIWVFYTFFDEDDKEFRRRNGEYHTIGGGIFDYDDETWMYTGDTYPQRNRHNTNTKYDNPYYIGTSSLTKNDPAYKKVPKRYKSTLKITVYNEKEKNGKSKD